MVREIKGLRTNKTEPILTNLTRGLETHENTYLISRVWLIYGDAVDDPRPKESMGYEEGEPKLSDRDRLGPEKINPSSFSLSLAGADAFLLKQRIYKYK